MIVIDHDWSRSILTVVLYGLCWCLIMTKIALIWKDPTDIRNDWPQLAIYKIDM